MEPFKQSKPVTILEITSALCGVIWLILFFALFYSPTSVIIGAMFIFLLLFLISYGVFNFLDKTPSYTREFMVYIEDRLNKTKSLEDLKLVEKEFNRLAIKDGMYCLSFPHSLRTIQAKILSQIEILEKINSNK